jgi:hypothetical protein
MTYTISETDLHSGDYFAFESRCMYHEVAFYCGDFEGADGPVCTRLIDGTRYDIFRDNPTLQVRRITKEEAISITKASRAMYGC